MDLAEFKENQRRMWGEGDYRPVGRLIEPAAQILVAATGVGTGQRVLDVGTGSGSVAVAAARAGAKVVGVDITDAWFDEARRRAGAAGVDLDLRLGDAESLPVDDGSFDVVLSSFAAIFAPRHTLVASEFVRVCRDGGTFGITAWTPDGTNNAVFSTLAERLPSPPEFVTPSILWGDEDHVRELFAAHNVTLRFERPTFPVMFESVEAFESFIFENSGGMIAARSALKELGRWDEAHAAMRDALDETNEADDTSYRVTWEFLLIVGTKKT
jgi:ubiquinone/menaquinone biosynthesis C-methylase UbiE